MAIIKLTNQNANIITGGTVATARLGSGTANNTTFLRGDQSYQALSEFNDDKLVNDISTLALHQATNNNSAKYNLANSNVDVYQDSSAIANLTNCARHSTGEYISTVYTTTGAYSNDSNTVLLLHLDNNVTDSSSNSITVTNNNSAAFSSSEYKFGNYSLQLNGTSQYLSTPDMDTVDGSVTTPTTGDYTMEAWFKLTVNDSSSRRLWAIGNNGAPSGGSTPIVSFGRAGSTTQEVNFWGSTPATNVNMNYSGLAYDTNWNHYCVMRKSSTTYFFYNGVRVNDTGHFEDDLTGHSGTIFIGARSGSTGEYVQGYVDEVRYSNNARFPEGSTQGDNTFTPNEVTANNATGSYESTAQTSNASVSKISAVVTYTNATGTNTLNTDIVLQVSANNGTNWSNATLTAAGTFSTGVLQAVTNDITVTAGTQLKYKISFANQASGSKVARINGVSLSY